MQQTLSATPLEAVLVEQRGDIADVWLRRNIVHDWHDLPDGGSQEFWSADEAHGTMPSGTTAEQVAASFDVLWEVFEREGMSAQEREAAQVRDAIAAREALGASADGYAPGYIAKGELFIAGGVAYVARCNIAGGERISEGINATRTTVAEYVNKMTREADNG